MTSTSRPADRSPDAPTEYLGGCHCGAVRFRLRVRHHRALACNCSVCAKKGMVNYIAAAEDFTLLRGADALATYRFHTETARHHFCRTCGIHPFSRPRSHPEQYDVNLRCLDGDALSRFAVEPFDGQNWEASVGRIR
ncbi:MAG: GFA family protein [Myxococcota bacterium]